MLWDFVLWDLVSWDFVRRDFVLWDFVLWDSVPDSGTLVDFSTLVLFHHKIGIAGKLTEG